MENYQVVLLMSVFVLLGALYVHKVEEKIVKIKDEIFQHGYEIKKGKEGLESTNKALIQVKVELETTIKELTQVKVELESTKKEVKQVQVELESTKKEVKQVKIELESTENELKQVKVELDTSKEKINKLRSEMIEKDNDRKKEINQIRPDVIAVREELNKIKTELHSQRPGFYVTLSSQMTLHQTRRIEFDQVKTDITNNYNKITGIFTVPKDGLYHFSLTMLSAGGNLHAEIMQNHQVIGVNHGTSTGDSGTVNVVMSCKQGDSVFVRHQAGQGVQKIHGNGYTAFSGFLIY